MTDAPGALGTILRESRRIAVVGLSPDPLRPSHEVASYLQSVGYRIVPVRPGGATILGEHCHPDLTSAGMSGPIDIVNIFRRSSAIPALLPELIRLGPRLVWMQVGVEDAATARALEGAGIRVVMNRCLMVDHPWLVSD